MTLSSPRGMYLYGITRPGPGLGEPLALLECDGLAAVVKPVPLEDYSPAALRERLRSAGELEALVRGHNAVIESVHARQAILPARFGMVYAHADDVVSSVRSAHDELEARLNRLEGCDEWAVHLFA